MDAAGRTRTGLTRPASTRPARGTAAQARGVAAEAVAVAALLADGWAVLGQRLRTPAGEVDIVVARGEMLAFVEVKARPSLVESAYALSARQKRRLLAAAGWLLAQHPGWARADTRFDVILVDAAGAVRRVTDAFRADNENDGG